MTAPQAADDMTELVDADIPRVDLVGKAANGTTFLLRKAADDGLLQPLVPAGMVRDLIAKAEEAPVTDPAPAPVAKDAPPVEADDLIEAAPAGGTADSLPGSPDWEQLDGDTAMNAVATLGRVKACLAWLSDREAQEAVTGDDPRDGDNAWDLDDMACQLDWMIGRLAGFAVGEHMEADMADELEQVGKAAAAMGGPLAVVEKLAPIRKAGRTLSAANEAALRTAAASIETVLNSLPAAPAEDVTKTEETPAVTQLPPLVMEITPTLSDPAAELLKSAPRLTAAQAIGAVFEGGQAIAKAKGDPQMAVFSADGKLVGVIDPADLNPIAATEAPSEGDTEGAGDDTPAPDAPAEPAAPAAQPDEKVIPGTQTVQAPPAAPEDDQTPAVAKTADTQTLEETVASLTKQVESLVADNGALKEQVRKFGLAPDDRRSPVLNGGTGTPGAVTRDVAVDNPMTEVLKAIDAEPDPVKRDEMRKAAFFAGVTARFQG